MPYFCKNLNVFTFLFRNWFNVSYDYTFFRMQEDINTLIQVDELLNRLTESEISFRRCMLIFCTVCIVAEYRKYEKICMIEPTESGLSAFANRKKSECIRKMDCLHLYIDTTTEIKITFKDIETFTATVLNPQFSTEFGMTLVETSRKIMSEANESYNPRLLKDLARCKIRACVPNSMMLTEQVKQLTIPKILKQFILFHSEEIWNFMIDNHETLLIVQVLVQHITDFGTQHNMIVEVL